MIRQAFSNKTSERNKKRIHPHFKVKKGPLYLNSEINEVDKDSAFRSVFLVLFYGLNDYLMSLLG